MNKFSITSPSPEPERKVYGHKALFAHRIYWQARNNLWYYFDYGTGVSDKANADNVYSNQKYFEPVYEPFSINIGF